MSVRSFEQAVCFSDNVQPEGAQAASPHARAVNISNRRIELAEISRPADNQGVELLPDLAP
jgi:hypothetical protein